MAKETRIHFLGKRFWIQERFIQVLSNYIAQAFIDLGLSTFNSNLLDLHDDCTINISGNNTGMVNLLLEVSITNENDKTSFINVLQNAKASILLIGSEIPISTLNQFESNKETVETRYFWTTPIKLKVWQLQLIISLRFWMVLFLTPISVSIIVAFHRAIVRKLSYKLF